jgi:hypothetical protein
VITSSSELAKRGLQKRVFGENPAFRHFQSFEPRVASRSRIVGRARGSHRPDRQSSELAYAHWLDAEGLNERLVKQFLVHRSKEAVNMRVTLRRFLAAF